MNEDRHEVVLQIKSYSLKRNEMSGNVGEMIWFFRMVFVYLLGENGKEKFDGRIIVIILPLSIRFVLELTRK
ncbi:hypothetical protein SNEBB_007628 [Seison nebaliae]|nr:hypothetical protein SNEBB_007628 [Seison nebaliae]